MKTIMLASIALLFIGLYTSAVAEPLEYTTHTDPFNPPPVMTAENGNRLKFDYTNDDNRLVFETVHGSFSFQKDTCTLRILDSNSTSVIPAISYTEKEAVFGSDDWVDSDLNSLECVFDYTITDNGITASFTKSNMILGVGEEYKTTYRGDYYGSVEVVYSHKNNNPIKNDHKFGFTQSTDGDYIIKVGDSVYDTSTIQNEITISKQDLDNKNISITTQNGVTIHYDTEDNIHDYLWAMKIKPHHINFDFTYAKSELRFGETLEIDPTIFFGGGTTAISNLDASNKLLGERITDTTARAQNLVNVVYSLKKVGSPTGNMLVMVRSVTGNTFIANSSGVDTSTLTTSFANYTFSFTGVITPAADDFRVLTNFPGGTGANYVQISGTGSGLSDSGAVYTYSLTGTAGPYTDDSAANHRGSLTYRTGPLRIELKPLQSDGSTLLGAGWVYKTNATNNQILVLNSSGYATSTDVTNGANYNYTVKDALDNFVVNKTINKAIQASQSKTSNVNINRISCGVTNPAFQVKTNATNYHNMTYFTAPACDSNEDVNYLARFVKLGLGPSTNQTTKIILRSLDTGVYNYSPSKVLVNGSSKTFTYTNNVLNATGIQVANGYNSVRLNVKIVTDNVTSAPTGLTATPGDSKIILDWTAPSAVHGDAVSGYTIWRNSTILVANTGSTNTSYSDTTVLQGRAYVYMVSAINRIGNSPWSNTDIETPATATTGTVTTENGVIGDTVQINSTVSITHASPSPVTVTQLKLYRNGTLVETKTVSVSVNNGSSSSNFEPFWNRMQTGDIYSYKIYATVSNFTGTVSIGSSNITTSREYDPSYANAVTNPSVEGLVNYTLSRFDDEDGIHLQVNRLGGTLGNTWEINCIVQTNEEASQTRNQSMTWPGTWINYSDVGYFNGTWTGLVNTHGYVTCFNPPGILFTTISYTNSSLALFGIQIFDNSYGEMLGVPVGIFFLAMAGAMANKRTAPTWIIVVLAMAGTMAAIGFFTFNPLIWGLALVTGLLGVLVNQKVF